MGCISSKMLVKSGGFQEKVSLSHSFQFQRSSVIEEIILSSSKSNGDQFLALLCAPKSSSARKANELEQSPAAAAAAAGAESANKIETINLSELLAGLEEENAVEQCGREDGNGSPAQCECEPEGAAAGTGRARSFRTVEEFDALLMLSSASERATAALERHQQPRIAAAAVAVVTSATAESNGGSSGQEEPAGAKRRARARQLGELKAPPAFDFSKSGSLRDCGGQTFSPGSYVTPKFGTATTAEHGGCVATPAGKQQEQAVFDPELVAQFERAMERLSEDEERALEEILEALELELDAGEKEEVAASLGALRVQE